MFGWLRLGQNLALAHEQALLDLGIEAAAQELDGDVLAEIRAFALRRERPPPCRLCRADAPAGTRRCAAPPGFRPARCRRSIGWRVRRPACRGSRGRSRSRFPAGAPASRVRPRPRRFPRSMRRAHPPADRRRCRTMRAAASSKRRRCAGGCMVLVLGRVVYDGHRRVPGIERRSATDKDIATGSAQHVVQERAGESPVPAQGALGDAEELADPRSAAVRRNSAR